MRKSAWFLIGLLIGLAAPVMGGQIPAPLKVTDQEVLLYLRRIYDEWLNVPIVTTSPNGSRIGRFGDIVVWNDSGTYRWRVNTSQTPGEGTTWSSLAD